METSGLRIYGGFVCNFEKVARFEPLNPTSKARLPIIWTTQLWDIVIYFYFCQT